MSPVEHGRIEDGAFIHDTWVHWDELDALQLLHNLGMPLHFERARIAFYEYCGRAWALDVRDNPDQHHVLKELRVEYERPFVGAGPLRVEVLVERIGSSSCVYVFRGADPEGGTAYATGRNVVVKLDPKTMCPAPWTDLFREEHERILVR